MRLSVFAEYDRVGAYFEAPTFAIKPQDPFATSATTRLGSSIGWGPITFTLEQRAQQSLAQYNASWLVPSSTYVIVGQGRVTAALDRGLNWAIPSPTQVPGSPGNVGKFYANFGYWMMNYQNGDIPGRDQGSTVRSVSTRVRGELIFISTSTVPRMRTLILNN